METGQSLVEIARDDEPESSIDQTVQVISPLAKSARQTTEKGVGMMPMQPAEMFGHDSRQEGAQLALNTLVSG